MDRSTGDRHARHGASRDVGGQSGHGVTKHINLLVVGKQDITKLADNQAMSTKQRKSAAYRLKGLDIQKLGEIEFLRLL